MSFAPTPEQAAAVSAFATGENLVIEAGAGTGKTSTLRQIADVDPKRQGLYLAFNKSVQVEAERKFEGTNVAARTAHSLAYAGFGRQMQHKLARSQQMRPADKADIIGIPQRLLIQNVDTHHNTKIARHIAVRLTADAVKAFCRTAQNDITANLVEIPPALQLDDGDVAQLQEQIVGYAKASWADIINPDGRLPYAHDFYMKQWAMSDPIINADYILFDEAQDADPLVTAVIRAQTNSQVVAVGDRSQAIYAWRGAVDAMDAFGGKRFKLTQSFRFGDAIAAEANVWLELLEADLRITGSDKPSSVWVSKNRLPEAILCRTNAGVIGEVIDSQKFDVPVAIAGKNRARQIRALAEACKTLMEQGWTRHPDLDMFDSWTAVQEYVLEDESSDLGPLVKLVDSHGPERLMSAIDACVSEDNARTVVATAHVAKGMEWKQVRISDDFVVPGRNDDGEIEKVDPSEAMLAYVSVTRAMRHLDTGGLGWVRDYLRALRRPEIGIEWRRRFIDARREVRETYAA